MRVVSIPKSVGIGTFDDPFDGRLQVFYHKNKKDRDFLESLSFLLFCDLSLRIFDQLMYREVSVQ